MRLRLGVARLTRHAHGCARSRQVSDLSLRLDPAGRGRPQRAAAGMATASDRSDPAPVAVVQRQLEAYNARDLDKFLSVFSDDVVGTDAVTGATMFANKAEMVPRYRARFSTPVHCELIGRLCMGALVVDREVITGLPDGAAADCLAIYQVQDGLIVRAQLHWQPRQQG